MKKFNKEYIMKEIVNGKETGYCLTKDLNLTKSVKFVGIFSAREISNLPMEYCNPFYGAVRVKREPVINKLHSIKSEITQLENSLNGYTDINSLTVKDQTNIYTILDKILQLETELSTVIINLDI